MTSYGRHLSTLVGLLVVCLVQAVMAADLTTLDGLRIHLPREGTYWYLKTPDAGLDRYIAATITLRDSKVHEMNFRLDQTNYVRVSCARPILVQLFQDASLGWKGRPRRSVSFDQLQNQSLELSTLHVSAPAVDADGQAVRQMIVRAAYATSRAELGIGYRTVITFSEPVSVTTRIEAGWKDLPLAPRGLIGTATDNVMDDLVGPRSNDRPLTSWSRSVVEDPVTGPRDPRFLRWLRDLQVRP